MAAVELGPALSVPIGVEMSVASARPSRSPSWSRNQSMSPSWSPNIFPTGYRLVAVLTLSRGATASATTRIWEAGTLGFTSPVIMQLSVEVGLNLALINKC